MENTINIDDRLKTLREDREKYYKIYSDIDKEITELEFKKKNVQDYTGRFVKVIESDDGTVYGKVTDTRRLSDGIRLKIKGGLTMQKDYLWASRYDDVTVDVRFDKLDTIISIDKETMEDVVEEAKELANYIINYSFTD